MLRNRRVLGVSFGAMVAVVAMASVAFACIVHHGKLVVASGSTTSTAIGDAVTSHGWCSLAGGATAHSGDTISVAMSPYTNTGASDPCPTNQAPDSADPLVPVTINPSNNNVSTIRGAGPYYVRFFNGNGFTKTTGATPTWSWNKPCYFSTQNGTQIGSMNIVNGSGSWSGALPASLSANGPHDDSAICVTSDRAASPGFASSGYGNMAPIDIL